MAWEQELQLAMELSEPLTTDNEKDCSKSIPTCRSCSKLDDKCSIKPDGKFKKVKSHDYSFGTKNRIVLKKSSHSIDTEYTYNKTKKGNDLDVKIADKLQNLDFIDRTPSPIERLDET